MNAFLFIAYQAYTVILHRFWLSIFSIPSFLKAKNNTNVNSGKYKKELDKEKGNIKQRSTVLLWYTASARITPHDTQMWR